LQVLSNHPSFAACSLRPCITVLYLSILTSTDFADRLSALMKLSSKCCHWKLHSHIMLLRFVRWIRDLFCDLNIIHALLCWIWAMISHLVLIAMLVHPKAHRDPHSAQRAVTTWRSQGFVGRGQNRRSGTSIFDEFET
jgi:hypothetical protein